MIPKLLRDKLLKLSRNKTNKQSNLRLLNQMFLSHLLVNKRALLKSFKLKCLQFLRTPRDPRKSKGISAKSRLCQKFLQSKSRPRRGHSVRKGLCRTINHPKAHLKLTSFCQTKAIKYCLVTKTVASKKKKGL